MLKSAWLGVGLVLFGVAMAAAQDYETEVKTGLPDMSLVVDAAKHSEPAEYWLGIQCYIIPPAMRGQLKLPEKQGLLVANVVHGSPAEKVGIVRFDILLRAAEKSLVDPSQLVEVIEATKEGKLKIELLRDGKQKTVEVAPAKRPKAADLVTIQKWLQGNTMDNYNALVRKQVEERLGASGMGPWQFRIIRPGAIVPGDVPVTAPLPENMSIAISKVGDQPAKIVVKRDKENWEVTEKELGKLPPDVRPHVERMLGCSLTGIIGGQASAASGGTSLNYEPGSSSFDRMEKRLDEMSRRMDKLMQEVEELGRGSKPSAPSEK